MTILKVRNAEVLVDDEDLEKLSKYNWRFSGKYVVRHQLKGEYSDVRKRKLVAIHTYIMNTPKGFGQHLCVDHINGNTLDNRKENLRFCTIKQNVQNRKKSSIVGKTSKYKGVARVSTNRFRTEIAHIVIGLFENERYAAMCYDLWAKDMYGEFARLNFN